MKREIMFGLLLTLLLSPSLLAQEARSAGTALPDLVAALKATPGCLGVETAQTGSGKQVIFAWFENKAALLEWYYSPVHRQLVARFFPTAPARTPLADISDHAPIMAVASLTMSPEPPAGVTSLPVSQIAIELYQPLPGGIALGGRFGPATLKVPGLMDVPLPAAAR